MFPIRARQDEPQRIYGATRSEWGAAALLAMVVCVSIWIAENAPPNWKYVRRKSCHLCGNRCVVVEQTRWWRTLPPTLKIFTNHPIPADHVHDWWQYDYNYFAPSFRYGGSKGAYYKDRSSWP